MLDCIINHIGNSVGVSSVVHFQRLQFFSTFFPVFLLAFEPRIFSLLPHDGRSSALLQQFCINSVRLWRAWRDPQKRPCFAENLNTLLPSNRFHWDGRLAPRETEWKQTNKKLVNRWCEYYYYYYHYYYFQFHIMIYTYIFWCILHKFLEPFQRPQNRWCLSSLSASDRASCSPAIGSQDSCDSGSCNRNLLKRPATSQAHWLNLLCLALRHPDSLQNLGIQKRTKPCRSRYHNTSYQTVNSHHRSLRVCVCVCAWTICWPGIQTFDLQRHRPIVDTCANEAVPQ